MTSTCVVIYDRRGYIQTVMELRQSGPKVLPNAVLGVDRAGE